MTWHVAAHAVGWVLVIIVGWIAWHESRRHPWQVVAVAGLVCLVGAAWVALGVAGGLAVAGVALLAVAWDGTH